MEYKIGSFNVHNLNYSSKKEEGRTAERFKGIAEIIKKEEFAIVALQEVLSDGALDQVMRALGDDARWKFAWETKASNNESDKRGEGYAYIWDSTKMDLVRVETNNGLREFLPRLWHQYREKHSLEREPYYARFSPVGKPGGCFCEIRLINTHIVYGDKSSAGIELRKKEFLKIVQNVYENVANKRYGNNMPAYVIVLGDYNLSLQQLNWVTINVGNSRSKHKEEKVVTRQEQLTTVSHTKQEDGTFKSDYVSNYDHFSFVEEYERIMHIRIECIEPTKYCKDLVEYWEKVSDHIPIKMTIDPNKRNTNKLEGYLGRIYNVR